MKAVIDVTVECTVSFDDELKAQNAVESLAPDNVISKPMVLTLKQKGTKMEFIMEHCPSIETCIATLDDFFENLQLNQRLQKSCV